MSSIIAAGSTTNPIAGPNTPTTYTPGVFTVPHPPSQHHPPARRRLIQEESDHEEQDGGTTDSESDNDQEESVADVSGDEDNAAEAPTIQAGARKTLFHKFLLLNANLYF